MVSTKSKSSRPLLHNTNTTEQSLSKDSPNKPRSEAMDTQTNGLSTTTRTTTTEARPPEIAIRRLRCLRSLPPFRVILTVAACVVMEATLGVFYTTGNLLPYMTSYLRNVTGETSVDYGRMLWVYNSGWLVAAATISLLGLVEKRIPNRIYILSGILINAGAFFGTYWTLQNSFIALVISYGVLHGIAQAILYPSAVNLGLRWFPHRKGLVGGITMAGYGGGSFIWNQIVTMWINPDNVQPDVADGENLYFTQLDLLHRVPTCFLLMGGILTTIQLLCLVSLSYPDAPTLGLTVETDDNTQENSVPNPDSLTSRKVEHLQTNVESETNWQVKLESSSETAKYSQEKFLPGLESETNSQEKLQLGPISGTKSQEKVQSTLGFAEVKTKSEDVDTESFYKSSALQPNVEHVDINTRAEDVDSEGHRSSDDVENGRKSLSVEDGRDRKKLINVSLLTERPVLQTPEYSVLQIVTSRALWTLWLNNLMLDFCFLFIVVFYKAFGQTFIQDDHLLALVASFASVFNAAGRPVWGLVADKIGYLPAMLINQGILVVMSGTFVTTELAGSSAMFFAWVCTIYSAFSGIYALQPTVMFVLFGSRNFIFSLGFITSTGLVSTLTSVPLAEIVLATFGWKGIFLLASGFASLAILAQASLLMSCGCPIPTHMRRGLVSSGSASQQSPSRRSS